MDYDLGSLNVTDDLLEDRQDLSQYSYDPTDMLDSIVDNQPVLTSFAPSQQSSQASEKLDDGFLSYADAGFALDEDADLFADCDDQMPTAAGVEHQADQVNILPTIVVDVVDDDGDDAFESSPVDVKAESSVDVKSTFPLLYNFYGNDITFDVKSELSNAQTTPSGYSPPDSTARFIFDTDESEVQLSITDDDLLSLSTRELNRRIRLKSVDEQHQLKSRRRTLKNRGYAQTCRTRRVGQRTELEADNDRLSSENERLKADNKQLSTECSRLRSEKLVSGQCASEMETIRAENKRLVVECVRLRQEGERFRQERDSCQSRLDALLSLFSNGIVVEGNS